MDQYQLFVIYLILFLLVGIGFIFVHLIVGKFIRPAKPDSEKMTTYECGEPTIGSAWIQFDLRFYVVALLFVIFDVEVAFFFPWAVVFGHVNTLANPDLSAEQRIQAVGELVASKSAVEEFATHARKVETAQQEGQKLDADDPAAKAVRDNIAAAREFGWIALADIAVFFGILLVGFAYLWKRGDLDWVRSVAAEKMAASGLEPSRTEDELVASAKE
jgi:NADH-quinone oxidoreductase subunit A